MAYWAATSIILAVTSLAAYTFVSRQRHSNEPTTLRRTIASPRETLLPRLTPAQAASLPYPPNLFTGARDVETPYGVMRVYEWGSEDGRKVILVHGDTTPGPMLGPVAEALVKRGCRVMIIGASMCSSAVRDRRYFASTLYFKAKSLNSVSDNERPPCRKHSYSEHQSQSSVRVFGE